MDAIRDEIEFLASSHHRAGVLDALLESPRDRRDLRTATGASSPTMGRVLTDLEERHWISRDGRTYQLTDLGRFVATRFREFREAMRLEHSVREVWPWLPHGMEGFGVELFTDAVVSRPGAGYPYEPIDRVASLVAEAETISGFGMVLLKSNTLEAFLDHVLDGMECEYIYPPDVFARVLSWDRELVTEAVAHDNFTVLLHDALPIDERCGICRFGDRVSFCCIDPGTGQVHALVDSAAPELGAWAMANHRTLRAEATPVDEFDDERLSTELRS